MGCWGNAGTRCRCHEPALVKVWALWWCWEANAVDSNSPHSVKQETTLLAARGAKRAGMPGMPLIAVVWQPGTVASSSVLL